MCPIKPHRFGIASERHTGTFQYAMKNYVNVTTCKYAAVCIVHWPMIMESKSDITQDLWYH